MRKTILAFLSVFICLLLTTMTTYGQDKIKVVVNGKQVIHTLRAPLNSTRTNGNCTRLPNRTIDGTCNNLTDPITFEYGATDIPLRRLYTHAYADGINSMAGPNRPNPRSISNTVVDQTGNILSANSLSSMVFTWGQFLDHDISVTPAGSESVPISLPANEPTFVSPMEFHRSLIHPGTGTTIPRAQTNLITAWIDGSNVYGSEQTRADWLRTFRNGKLKTSAGALLPYNTTTSEQNGPIDPTAPSMAGEDTNPKKFIAGDVRASEQPGLTSLHTLFVREHNRICDQLIASGMSDDEALYQRARKIVGALMQKITFEEFLPALGLDLESYTGYDPAVNPNIFNEFSTAAYRIGHTMVTEHLPLADNNGHPTSNIPLMLAFFNPSIIASNGVEPILMGLMHQTQQEVDPFVVSALRNFLFPIPGSAQAFGLDLVSLNIQRGRDHGLISYMSLRDLMSCEPITGFDQISSDPIISTKLAQAYNNDLEAIDLWVGLLAEDKLAGSSFSHTMSQLLYKQFSALRDGDFYYYENDPALSTDDRNCIKATTLEDVILRNTTINNLSTAFYN